MCLGDIHVPPCGAHQGDEDSSVTNRNHHASPQACAGDARRSSRSTVVRSGGRRRTSMALETWNIDTVHSSVSFSVRHLMIAKVRGHFSKWSGTLAFDEQNPTASHAEAK